MSFMPIRTVAWAARSRVKFGSRPRFSSSSLSLKRASTASALRGMTANLPSLVITRWRYSMALGSNCFNHSIGFDAPTAKIAETSEVQSNNRKRVVLSMRHPLGHSVARTEHRERINLNSESPCFVTAANRDEDSVTTVRKRGTDGIQLFVHKSYNLLRIRAKDLLNSDAVPAEGRPHSGRSIAVQTPGTESETY